jgi:hypothetical protein
MRIGCSCGPCMTDQEGVTLRQYIESLMTHYEKAHRREHELLSESLILTAKHLETRLEGMNEFRAQILSERQQMVTLDKFLGKMDELEKVSMAHSDTNRARIVTLEVGLANIRGRLTATAAALAVGLTVLEIIMRVILP